jgi:putative transposon-encoded protein
MATCLSSLSTDMINCVGCRIQGEELTMENNVEDKQKNEAAGESADVVRSVHPKVKFEVFGEEMIEKDVKSSGNSGRVYLPPDWVGHRVKIIRID